MCGEYTQLLFQAHSAGSTGEQEVIKLFMTELVVACTAHIGMLLMHLQPPQCPEAPNVWNALLSTIARLHKNLMCSWL